MTIKEMIKANRVCDVYILARYFYRIGNPFINDSIYDQIDNMIRRENPPEMEEYLNRTYDDDQIPYKLLEEIGVKPIEDKLNVDNSLFTYLDTEKSLSITSVTTYDDAFKFFNEYRVLKKDLVVSLKLDGDNAKTLYLDGQLKLSLSRGRSGIGFDFTDTIKYKLPVVLKEKIRELKIYSECFVDEDYLPVLRKKYNSDRYKTPKSAAISLLRVKHRPEDYEHFHVIVHGVDTLGNTIMESFSKAKELGFNIVDHKLIQWKEIPDRKDEFIVWLNENVMDYLYFRNKSTPSDGVVVEVNDLAYLGTQVNQYSSRQLALKFYHWNFKLYKGIVEEIIWEQRRVYASCRIRIKPMLTDDGCSAEYINSFNFSILVSEGITVGSEVYYVRNSQAVNVLVYGRQLDRLLGR